MSGAALPTIIIGGARSSDAGSYDCVITGPCGTATSDAVTLTVVAVCAADVAGLGGAPGPDGQLGVDDVVFFLSAFFTNNLAVADIVGLGGTSGPDGVITADDLVAFLASFFAGCS